MHSAAKRTKSFLTRFKTVKILYWSEVTGC
jgi:hypothetical protein